MKKLLSGSVLAIMTASIMTSPAFAQTADLVVTNAKISTQNNDQPSASALAVVDGVIIDVGDPWEVSRHIGRNTKVIDADGRRIVPGIVDSHSHFLRSGLTYTRELRWDGVPSLKIGLDMIREAAKTTPEGEWVRVIGGWTPWQFEEKRFPTPEELSAAAPNTPVYLQYFYSTAIVNDQGLKALNITRETPDPKGGRFVRGKDGNPTGLMQAEPHPGIFYGKIAALPGASKEVETNSTIHMFHELARWGITGVIDAGGGGFNYPAQYSTSEKLAVEGKLPIRSTFYLFAQRPKKELEDFRAWSDKNRAGKNTDPSKAHGFELDGAGEYILWESADFENFKWERPTQPASMEENLEAVLTLLVEKKWPFKIHATYDESIVRILNVIEKVNEKTPFNGLRWSIEHGETIKPESVDRIIALGGGLAIQNRMVFLGDDFVARYGDTAAKHAPPLRYLVDSGIPLGMGTDATRGSTFNPWVSLHYLITGETASGLKLYGPDNVLTREEALLVHTVGSAWFSQEENEKGRIAEGQFADFAILNKDYFTIPVEDIPTIQSILTVVNGNIVYGSQAYASLSPELPAILPAWSPVSMYGAYWREENKPKR